MHRYKRSIRHLLPAALSLGVLTFAQSPQANNSVKIKDEEGKNVPNPKIELIHANDNSKSKKGDGDSNGDFVPANLADGDYKVCVNMPGTMYINPCQWKKNPPTVNVKNGKLPGNFSVTAERGVTFKIHVNDQFGSLIPGPGKPQASSLNTQVTSEASFPFPMRLVRRNARGFDYELTVPFDSDMDLSLRGAPVFLSINNGAKSDASKSGAAAKLRVPKGTIPNVLRVDVHEPVK